MTPSHSIRPIAIFPGQGDPRLRLSPALARHPHVQAVFQRAHHLLGYAVPSPEDASPPLQQLALFTASMAVWELLGPNTNITAIAGISLGEYAAAVAAGALSFEDGLQLVEARTQCMAQWASPGNMMAILGISCDQWQSHQAEVFLACRYGPTEHIVSGPVPALSRLGALVSQLGGRVVAVNAGIPSHSPYMAPALPCLKRVMDRLDWRRSKIPWISTMDGRVTRHPTAIKERLLAQIVSPVNWPKATAIMQFVGHHQYLDIGPGHSVSRLLRRTVPDAQIYGPWHVLSNPTTLVMS